MPDILFLDDSKERTKKFQSMYPNAICVETAKECIKKLDESAWEFLFLDHDLGDQVFVDSSREDTGMEVVRWIEKNVPVIKQIYVHTLNVPAGQSMVDKLRDAGYNALYKSWLTIVSTG